MSVMKSGTSWRWPTLAVVLAITTTLFVPTLATGLTGRDSAQPVKSSWNWDGPKPTIVLVHGAWADSSGWDGVIQYLQAKGFAVDAPPNPLEGLPSDSAFLASYLKTITGAIVLVGHSYGGAVITNAAVGNPNVKALVYVDAFEPAKGETLEQLTFARPGSCLAGGGDLSNVFNFGVDPSLPSGDYDLYLKTAPGTDYPGFADCFANDVPPSEAALFAVTQRPLALDAFTATNGTPAWRTIPSWAVIGTQDRAIPPAELTFMAQRAHSKIEYVKAGHLSMVAQPLDVADVIEEAARATS